MALASATLLLAASTNSQAQYRLLHSFAGSPKDGCCPDGSLTLVGSTLYGMTYYGGSYSDGTIFQINTDGSAYTNLHSFAGSPGDGANAEGSLTLLGSALYGMTDWGGSSDSGTVFQINTDGSGYTNLHSFGSVPNDGANPYGDVTLVGSTLYGMTREGGSNNYGMIFLIDTNGSGYTILHSFAGGANDGAWPLGDVAVVGATLYGMTYIGGSSNAGTIFQINTDGSGYTNVHSFAGSPNDGRGPYGLLTLVGAMLYGMTYEGGSSNEGAIFRINTDGSGYTNLHSFGDVANDGLVSFGSLTLVGLTLYGMTYEGGSSDSGTLFQINTDGSGYTNLHSFGSVANDGANPYGDVTLVGSTLYGMTYQGGSNKLGVIFSLALPSLTPPGPLTIKKLQAKVNLNPAKWDIDTCSLTASPALESGFSVANQTVTVDVGGAQATFTLNAKGSSKSSTNSCKFTYAKKTKLWTLTASMKKGSWAIPWAAYGVINATTPKAGLTVTMPVLVTVGTNTFATEDSLLYKATAGKTGTLK
jgi:uncharacterized repeat protein (TIGR03803 family)